MEFDNHVGYEMDYFLSGKAHVIYHCRALDNGSGSVFAATSLCCLFSA